MTRRLRTRRWRWMQYRLAPRPREEALSLEMGQSCLNNVRHLAGMTSGGGRHGAASHWVSPTKIAVIYNIYFIYIFYLIYLVPYVVLASASGFMELHAISFCGVGDGGR